MPAIVGFAQTPVESEVADAHVDHVTRRALERIFDGRVPRTFSKSLLAPKTKVYFFEKKSKQGVLNTGFVQDAKEDFVELNRSVYGYVKRRKVFYEGIRLFPFSSLLQELDQAEMNEEGGLETSSMEAEEHAPSLPSTRTIPSTTPPMTNVLYSQKNTLKLD